MALDLNNVRFRVLSLSIEELELNLDFLNRPSEQLKRLHDLSIAAAVSLIWNSKEMKMAIEEVLDKHKTLSQAYRPLNMEALSVKISETVSNIFNNGKDQILLPQVLITEIEKKVLEKVEKLLNWILYLIRDLKLDYKAAERIYWSADGRINEDKIFRYFWSDQLAEEPVKWKNFDNSLNLLQYLACVFGQEEFISLHQSDYIEAIKSLEIENNDVVLSIMKTVIFYYDNVLKLRDTICSERVEFHIADTSIVGILSICKNLCFHQPFLFFWNRLDATERFNYLESVSRNSTSRRSTYYIYRIDQFSKIVQFLMEQMNETQKYNFILNNFPDVILTFSRNKNCKKFCMPLVEHFLPIINGRDKRHLLTICADICNCSIQYDIELEILHRLLKNQTINRRRQWYYLTIDIPMITGNNHEVTEIFNKFFENFKLPVLKFIIKNESSERRKKNMISLMQMKYVELIRHNNFQVLDKFLDEVLSSKTEKDQFKQDYNFLGVWIAECRFDIADNVLIWMHGASSQEFKAQYINIFWSSIRRDYEAIEKLLRWFFDAPGPLINNCQSKLELLNEFCCGLIYKLWFPKIYDLKDIDIDTAINISRKILIFSFFSEKEIQHFKTNVLANEENCINFFCKNGWHSFEYWEQGQLAVFEDFLNFCNLPEEKMDYIRRSTRFSEKWRNWPLVRQIRGRLTEESE